MKRLSKVWLGNLCVMCMLLAGHMHWGKISLLLFGEQPYPQEPEK